MQMRLRKSSRPVTQAPNNVSLYCIALVRNKVISERDLPPCMGHCISLRNDAVYPQCLMVTSELLVRPRAIIKSFVVKSGLSSYGVHGKQSGGGS
jgi:hypothetical protein